MANDFRVVFVSQAYTYDINYQNFTDDYSSSDNKVTTYNQIQIGTKTSGLRDFYPSESFYFNYK